MIFLIEYDRAKGQTVEIRKYSDENLMTAQNDRLHLEMELIKKGINHEVVILEARNENALRRTHERYFETVEEILKSSKDLES